MDAGAGAPPGSVNPELPGATPKGAAPVAPRTTLRVPHVGQMNSPVPETSSSARHRPHRTITAANAIGCAKPLFPGSGLRCESGRTHTQRPSRSSSAYGPDPTPSVRECDAEPHPPPSGRSSLSGVFLHVPDPGQALCEQAGGDRLRRVRRLRRLLVRARRHPTHGLGDAGSRLDALGRTPNPDRRAAGVS